MNTQSEFKCRTYLAGFILCLAVFLVYSNSFDVSWHFDDLPNITLNPHIHMEELNKESFVRAMYGSPLEMRYEGRRLYRPVATVSLALNWYFGRENVFGYHLVNVLIHFSTTIFIYLAVSLLLKSPNLTKRTDLQIHHISLLATILWALHPIQTQAVTYIVQRMAAMAALFSIGGIYFYLRFRNLNSGTKPYFNLFVCGCFYVLGIGSKENAAILPISIALIEIIFYQNISDKKTRQKILFWTIVICITIFFIGTVLFYLLYGNPIEFMSQLYLKRPFTLSERLMTQSRVFFKYISLIFWPSSERLSLIHSIPLSTSIGSPWTTLPSIFGVGFLFFLGLLWIRRYPVLSFSILFFMVNHVIESTFIPLEIFFEHRNYLPTTFLFLPLAVAIERGISNCGNRGWIIKSFSIFIFSVLIASLGIGTYSRNLAWSTPKTLWNDVLRKHPDNPRPYQVLADQYKNENKFDYALAFLYKSIDLQKNKLPSESLALSFNNIGNIYVELNEFNKAKRYFNKAIQAYGRNEIARYNLVFTLIRLNEYDEALERINELLQMNPNHNKYLNLKGFILYKINDYDAALWFFKRSLRLAPKYLNALINMSMTFSRLGNYERADWFLRRAQAISSDDIGVMLARIDNAHSAGRAYIIEENLNFMFKKLTVNDFLGLIKNDGGYELLPFDLERILPLLQNHLDDQF